MPHRRKIKVAVVSESLQAVVPVLAALRLPDTEVTLGETGARIRAVEAEGRVVVEIVAGFPCLALRPWLEAEAAAAVAATGRQLARLELHSRIVSHAVQPNVTPMPSVRNLIAIGSGKG